MTHMCQQFFLYSNEQILFTHTLPHLLACISAVQAELGQ